MKNYPNVALEHRGNEMTLLIAIIAAVLCILLLIARHYRIHLYAFYTGFPQPKHRIIIEKDVKIPMLDGIQLAADVYRPRSRGKHPVILARTPYNKNSLVHAYKQLAELFASQGYVVVIQDIRGKYGRREDFCPTFTRRLMDIPR